ncbi:MAG TPA: tetratricopeptide repeat protein [Polyangiaceae bacterium]|nr:tetratricopeptide repeat protein [Polyangiaceae bacterium]
MKVVDLHPEELIDKLAVGSLTPAERERLNAHLGQCSSCRFELSVRADLSEDAPAFEQRPQWTFTGSAPPESPIAAPRQLSTLQVSLRPRSRHRWPLVMLAAALVLCAGGAMGAVLTGAVSTHWLPWSPPPKRIETSVPVSDLKPAAKPKRAIAARVIAPVAEPIVSSAAPAVSALPATSAVPEGTALPVRVAVVNPSLRVYVPPRRGEAALATSGDASGASVGALPGSAEPAVKRADPAAALFADANRARRDGNVDRAVGLYRTLQSRYPSSSESELSRALLAQLLLDRGNPEAALAGFDRYLAEDTPVLNAEALVGRARALEQLGKLTQAAAAWRQVQSRFPGSVHARLAATRLPALGMR